MNSNKSQTKYNKNSKKSENQIKSNEILIESTKKPHESSAQIEMIGRYVIWFCGFRCLFLHLSPFSMSWFHFAECYSVKLSKIQWIEQIEKVNEINKIVISGDKTKSYPAIAILDWFSNWIYLWYFLFYLQEFIGFSPLLVSLNSVSLLSLCLYYMQENRLRAFIDNYLFMIKCIRFLKDLESF